MKKILIFAVMFLLAGSSYAAITSAQVQFRSLNNNTLADSCVNARTLGASVVEDTELASTIEGRIFLTMVYDSQVFNTAGLAAGGNIITQPANAMSGSLTIERLTIFQTPVAENNETFCVSLNGGTTYDTVVVVTAKDSVVLSSFTNFATWTSGAKLDIRVSGGGSNTTRYCVNFIIQAKYSIKND